MFDTARVGDRVRYCKRTFGLRPSEEYGPLVEVVGVEQSYYGTTVVTDDGERLSSDMHHMVVIYRGGDLQGWGSA